jgi:glycosyltransferase involved in cell wall biosynthesis
MLGEKLRQASFARTISEHNRRLLERLYGPEASARTHVIHCGVDVKAFEERGPDRDGPDFTIVCVASMKEYKGHRYLLEALAAMAASGQRFRCLLVGDGKLRPEIVRRVAQPDLADSVTVCGTLPAERVRSLLAGADAAVLASVVEETGKMEGIPVFLMEAMAAGLPVVATQISGVAELVEDGVSGLLVPERDPAALAAALSRLAGDPELRRRFGQAGRDRVRDSFELTRTVAALRDLLLEPPMGRG